jgi:hypothetical protein
MSEDGIDGEAIAKLMAGIQREFDKHQIHVPVEADANAIHSTPVINVYGDRAQLAWGNQTVTQTQADHQIAPGFEAIAQAVASVLEQLPATGLAGQDLQDAEDTATEVLAEVAKAQPDRGKVRRALSALKWIITPLLSGASEGIQEWARTAVQHLDVHF